MHYKNGEPKVTLQQSGGQFLAIIAHTNGRSTSTEKIYEGYSMSDALRSIARYSVSEDLPSLDVYPLGLIVTQKEEDFLEQQSGGSARIVYSR